MTMFLDDPNQHNLILDGLTAMVSISVLAWGLRRKGDMDYELDAPARSLRWFMVGIGWAVLLIGVRLDCGPCPWSGFIVATAFLAWPNFAYHMTRVLRLCRLLPPGKQI